MASDPAAVASDPAGAVHAAVAGGTLTDDTARAILRCIDADGCIDAPNDLLERVAREVIEAAGVEFRLAKGSNLPATPGKRSEQAPKRRRQTPIAPRRRPFRPPPEALRGRRSAASAENGLNPLASRPRPALPARRLRRPLPGPHGSPQRRDRALRLPGPPRNPLRRPSSSAPIPRPSLP